MEPDISIQNNGLDKGGFVTPETTILDIVSRFNETEGIFKQMERETGVCICCQGLFLSLGDAARRFGFHLEKAIADINFLISRGKK